MYELITTNAAKTLRITDRYGIEEGKPANLIVVDAAGPRDALRLVPARLYVIKDGRVVAQTTPSHSRLLREDGEETVRFT